MPDLTDSLDLPGIDTWLARLLHERGRLELELLQALLNEVRTVRAASGMTLARKLVEDQHLSQLEVESCLTSMLAARTPQISWEPSSHVGPYLLVDRLGAGGMGVVFRAEDTRTGAPLAIKTISLGADPEMLLRFEREAHAHASVDRHPNVVRIHAAGRAGGQLYLVMDLAAGGDLASRLTAGPLEPVVAATLVRDVARGLAHCHTQGVLHRDIKPANLLFDAHGTPQLVDFGLAHLASAHSLTASGTLMGTPSYMAPEQAEAASDVGPAADVYGLGAVLYHCLTGRPPFQGGGVMNVLNKVLRQAPTPPRELVPTVPSDLSAICLRALSKKPADRFPSADALSEALDQHLRGEVQPESRFRLLVVVLLLGLICGAAALGWRLQPDQEGETADVTESLSEAVDDQVFERALERARAEPNWRKATKDLGELQQRDLSPAQSAQVESTLADIQVKALRAALDHRGPETTTEEVARALVPGAVARAVEHLVTAVENQDDLIATRGARALALLDPKAIEPAVPALIRALLRKPVRLLARQALVRAGDLAKPELITAIDNGQAERHWAAGTLLLIDPRAAITPRLLNTILVTRPEQSAVRVAAAKAVMGLEPEQAERAVWGLVSARVGGGKTEYEVRVVAERALLKIGEPAIRSLEETLLEDENVLPRARAAQTLMSLGHPAIERLTQAMTSRRVKPKARIVAAQTLIRLGKRDAVAPVIARIVADRVGHQELPVSDAADQVIQKVGAPAIPALLKALDSKSADARTRAAHSLSGLGRTTTPALSRIVTQRLRDPVGGVRKWLHQALIAIGAPAVEPMIRALDDEDTDVQGRALRTLDSLGPVAAPAVPALIGVTGRLDGEVRVRIKAREVLKAHSVQAFPKLLELLDGEDARQRARAAWVLGGLDPRKVDAVPALLAALGDTTAAVRIQAMLALGNIGDAKRSVRSIGPLLKGRYTLVRYAAAIALAQLGRTSPRIVALVNEALRSKDPQILRKAKLAKQALDRRRKR